MTTGNLPSQRSERHLGRARSSAEPTTHKVSWASVGFFAAIHGLALLAPWFFSWSALGVAIALHRLCGSVGICLGYHRLLSHRSFRVPKWLERVIATVGALALQGGPSMCALMIIQYGKKDAYRCHPRGRDPRRGGRWKLG